MANIWSQNKLKIYSNFDKVETGKKIILFFVYYYLIYHCLSSTIGCILEDDSLIPLIIPPVFLAIVFFWTRQPIKCRYQHISLDSTKEIIQSFNKTERITLDHLEKLGLSVKTIERMPYYCYKNGVLIRLLKDIKQKAKFTKLLRGELEGYGDFADLGSLCYKEIVKPTLENYFSKVKKQDKFLPPSNRCIAEKFILNVSQFVKALSGYLSYYGFPRIIFVKQMYLNENKKYVPLESVGVDYDDQHYGFCKIGSRSFFLNRRYQKKYILKTMACIELPSKTQKTSMSLKELEHFEMLTSYLIIKRIYDTMSIENEGEDELVITSYRN